jgi:glycosyltransferase involved in cell wall biosynthesis
MRRNHSQPKLCVVVHGPYPVGEARIEAQVHAALDRGFAVDVLAHRRPGERRRDLVDGARVLRFPFDHKQGSGALRLGLEYVGFTSAATLAATALSLRSRYDVFQVSNPPDFLMAAAVVPKLLGARVILDVHDFSSDLFQLRFGDRPRAEQIERTLVRLEQWAARVANAVIVPHERYKRELVERGTPPQKIRVVMNSPDERSLPDQPAVKDGFRVVYHGTLTRHYGVHVLVEAVPVLLDEIPELRLEIYGDGDALEELVRKARELGVEDHVAFSGEFLPHKKVLAAVAGAAVGVIPNLAERHDQRSLSAKLLEYVALGIPVIAADLATIREHFSASEILYFEAGDSRALASRLLEVKRDPGAAERRALAARARYENYRWSVSAEEYAAALRG